MHIALITHKVTFQDGQGRVNYEIAKAALHYGHHVTVVGEFCANDIAKHPRGSFVQILKESIPTRLLRDQYFATRSAEWVRRHRDDFDIIQANGFVTWEPVDVVAVHYVHSAWLRNEHYPFRWSSLNPYAYYQRTNTVLNRRFEQGAFRSARRVVAVSRVIAREVECVGIEQRKIEVVPNGVDSEEFSPGKPARSEFGLPDQVPVALFAGDIKTPRKNLDSVLKALKAIPGMHLAVAGEINGSPYPDMARTLELQHRVHFIGKTKRMAELMRSSDVFVFPSRYEPFGLVALEAMACGLPVVASTNFGAAEFMNGGGVVFGEPDNVDALVAAIQRLLSDKDLRVSMGQAGRKAAISLSWAKTAAGYLRVYEQLMDHKKLATA